MMRSTILALALAVAAVPAQAAVMQAVYTGTVTNSFNYTNNFGLTGVSSLDGQAYVLTFVYNTALGITDNAGESIYLYGGTNTAPAPVPSPVTSATLLINGQTVQAPPSNGIVAVKKSPPCAICENFVQHTASNSQGANTPNSSAQTLFGQFKSTTAAVPLSLTQAFSLTAPSGTSYDGGEFGFTDIQNNVTGTQVSGQFLVQSVTVTVVTPDVVVAPVPLPASAALLLVGLGAIGAMAGRLRAARRNAGDAGDDAR